MRKVLGCIRKADRDFNLIEEMIKSPSGFPVVKILSFYYMDCICIEN
jgi:hypothetical protein